MILSGFESRVGPADEFIGMDSEDPNSFLKNFFSLKIQICLTTLTESELGGSTYPIAPSSFRVRLYEF